MGLWQESGAMQRHKFLGEAAEAPEITPLLLSSTERSVPGLLPLVLPPQGQAILRLEDPILVRSACFYTQSRILLLSLEPADSYDNKLSATLTVVRIDESPAYRPIPDKDCMRTSRVNILRFNQLDSLKYGTKPL